MAPKPVLNAGGPSRRARARMAKEGGAFATLGGALGGTVDSLMGAFGSRQPKTLPAPNGSVYENRECLGTFEMSSVYNVLVIALDPTNAAFTPWLAEGVINGYQEYEFESCVVEVEGLASNTAAGSATGLGTIGIAAKYDPLEMEPLNMSEALNTLGAVSIKPTQKVAFRVECGRANSVLPRLKVRSTGSSGADEHFYSMGNLFICTEGAANDYTGAFRMYVRYKIRLTKNKLPDGGNLKMTNVQLHNCDTANPIRSASLEFSSENVPLFDNIGVQLPSNAGVFDLILFPPDLRPGSVWLVMYTLYGPSTSTTVFTGITASGGLSTVNGFIENTAGAVYVPETSSVSTQRITLHFFSYDGSGTVDVPPQLLFTAGGSAFATCSGNLYIMEVNPLFDQSIEDFRGVRHSTKPGAFRRRRRTKPDARRRPGSEPFQPPVEVEEKKGAARVDVSSRVCSECTSEPCSCRTAVVRVLDVRSDPQPTPRASSSSRLS